jgi:hypothetical protein
MVQVAACRKIYVTLFYREIFSRTEKKHKPISLIHSMPSPENIP